MLYIAVDNVPENVLAYHPLSDEKDEKPRVLKYCQYDDSNKYLILLKHRNSVHSVMRHIDAVTHDHQANQVAPNKHFGVCEGYELVKIHVVLCSLRSNT